MKKVITYGTYDLFHEGHYNLLKRAKALGDYLIVGVTTEYYDLQRGKLNVVDSVLERVENVRRTGLADEIIIEEDGVPKVYKKVWDPEQEEYVYILDEDVPLVTSPRTGVTGNGSSAALPAAAAVLGLGGLAALAKGKKSAC